MTAADRPTSVHALLAELAEGGPDRCVVDLGAGSGATLAAVAARHPAARLVAIDRQPAALARLRRAVPTAAAVLADLRDGVPCRDGSVDRLVSHNVLESLPDRGAFLTEVARTLRPRGRLVLAHTDFEGIVIAGADRDLTRRVLLTYAELSVRYLSMADSDGQMGRQLAGLVRHSALRLLDVRAHVTVCDALTGAARSRVDEVTFAVRRIASRHAGPVSAEDIDRWAEQLREADADGSFFFSEPAFAVVAGR